MKRLLVVEDEEHLATGLRFNLEAEGYGVDVAETGEAALNALDGATPPIDLVLLDVMLPGIDGFEVVRRLREGGSFVPVVMLTARGENEDVLRGLEVGADDYLPKPFDLSILLARIGGLLRRKEWLENAADDETGADQPDEVVFNGRRIDFVRQVMEKDGVEFSLTLMEAMLLRHLVANEGRPVSRKTLLEEVWGVRQDTDTRTVDNFIARLRRLVEDEPSNPQHIQTVRGVWISIRHGEKMTQPVSPRDSYERQRVEALVHGSRALGEPRSTSWPSWRQQVHDLDMKSRVHPKYKTKYHVGNWPAYDRALVQRGDITVWLAPDAIAAWEAVGVGKRGGQLQYSDLAIETALTLRLIFHLPLRQTEGFLTSIFGMLGLDLSAPDHTTLSRRGQHLDLPAASRPHGCRPASHCRQHGPLDRGRG